MLPFSVTHILQNFPQRHHALDAHTTNFHFVAISRIPILFDQIVAIVGLSQACFFQIDFFHSGRMTKFLPGQSEQRTHASYLKDTAPTNKIRRCVPMA